VYFDDFKVTQTKSNVIQYNEYYPFGLQTSTSWTRDNSKNDFLYNAGSELNASSGWYETMFRGYDPAIGRFLQVDPLAHIAYLNTFGGGGPDGGAWAHTVERSEAATRAAYAYHELAYQLANASIVQTVAKLEAEPYNKIQQINDAFNALFEMDWVMAAQQGFPTLVYEKTHSFLGAVTGDYEEGFNSTLATGFLATYEMTVRLRVRTEFIYENGKVVGQKWIANLSASSFASSGKLADTRPWVNAQMLVDGTPTPITRLAINSNSIYHHDMQNTFVGELEWEIPAGKNVQFLYEGSWIVNGWQTPTIGHAVNFVPILATGNIGYIKILSNQ
jgi:RHS repeat-associated protein